MELLRPTLAGRRGAEPVAQGVHPGAVDLVMAMEMVVATTTGPGPRKRWNVEANEVEEAETGALLIVPVDSKCNPCVEKPCSSLKLSQRHKKRRSHVVLSL